MDNVSLKEAAAEKRKEYQRQYRAKNRDKINANLREWQKAHPEKMKEYAEKYWINQVLKSIPAGERS